MLLLEANVSNTVIYILSGVIIGILIGLYLKNNLGGGGSKKTTGGGDSLRKDAGIHGEENMENVIKLDDPSPVEKRFSEQLSSKLEYFSGSMNALSDIVSDFNKDNADLTFGNIEQLIDLHGNESDKKSFVNDRNDWDERLYKEKAKDLLSLFQGYGIAPSEEKNTVWEARTADRYRKSAKMEVGQKCEVVAPYWTYKGDIFEKGVVRPR